MARARMEGWMVRYGRRKIGRSFFHKRYFVLEPVMLAYYKRKPSDKEVPLKSLLIDGNCRVQDRGLETHHGHAVYVLSIYNMKDKSHRITMAALNIQDACQWKEALEQVIDQHLGGHVHIQPSPQQFDDMNLKVNERERTASSSDRESIGLTAQEEEEKQGHLCGNGCVAGLPDSVQDWTSAVEPVFRESEKDPLISRKHMRLVRCQNGLRVFEEIPDVSRGAQSPYRAMMAVGVVEASCADIFELIMNMDETRYEWDCSFHVGSLVEEVDGHTQVLYHRLQIEWFPMLVWPRDLCYTRYWRRNDDGSYVILFRSRDHPLCPPQPGCVRAHMESGGFTISPLQSRGGSTEPRARVQHLVEFDLKGWGVGRVPFFQQHTMIQMLNSVAGLREWFSQRDGSQPTPAQRIAKLGPELVSTKKSRKRHPQASPSIAQVQAAQLEESLQDEDSDDEADDFVVQDKELVPRKLFKENSSPPRGIPEDLSQPLDISAFPGSLKLGDLETGKNCWSIPHGNNFRVRSKRFLVDRSKVPAGEPQLQLVAVDWFKDTKRMDNLAKRKDCAAQVAAERGYFTIAFNIQVPGSMHYSMVFYFVAKQPLAQGSLLQRFVDGDDSFRNSRLKLIPSVPKGSWIVRQSVGSTPCILGKAVDCTYIRGPRYLEVDADIGSSTVANGVLSLVFGVVTSLVVDMAFLVQGNGMDELPERIIGAVRVAHLELGAAISPVQNESV